MTGPLSTSVTRPALRREEEFALLTQYQQLREKGDPEDATVQRAKQEIIDRVITSNMRYVYMKVGEVARKLALAASSDHLQELIQAGHEALRNHLETFRAEKVKCPETFRFISYASKGVLGAILKEAQAENTALQSLRPCSWDDVSPWLSAIPEESTRAGTRPKRNGDSFYTPYDVTTDPTYMILAEKRAVQTDANIDEKEQRLQVLLKRLTPEQTKVLMEYARQIATVGETIDRKVADSLGVVRSAVTRMTPRIAKRLGRDYEELLPIFRYLLEQLRQGRYDEGTHYA